MVYLLRTEVRRFTKTMHISAKGFERSANIKKNVWHVERNKLYLLKTQYLLIQKKNTLHTDYF